ncbi:MAG: DUF4423 domain-containing protein [Bdellovibrionia bacterium]
MLNTPQTDFRTVLRKTLEERRSRNSSYSLRAFSRDLGVSPTALSQILNEKRKFSAAAALKVAANLRMNDDETRNFIEQATARVSRHAGLIDRRLLREDQFRALSEWHYLAILNLARIDDCQADPKWIAQRLGLQIHLAETALDSLVRLELVRIEGKRLLRTSQSVTTGDDVPSRVIRRHHKEKLTLAAAALEELDVSRREFLAITMPACSAQMSELKSKLRKLADKFVRASEERPPNEVYALNIQFFPLSRERNV